MGIYFDQYQLLQANRQLAERVQSLEETIAALRLELKDLHKQHDRTVAYSIQRDRQYYQEEQYQIDKYRNQDL